MKSKMALGRAEICSTVHAELTRSNASKFLSGLGGKEEGRRKGREEGRKEGRERGRVGGKWV